MLGLLKLGGIYNQTFMFIVIPEPVCSRMKAEVDYVDRWMMVNASARQGNDTLKEVWPCNPGPAAWSFDQSPINIGRVTIPSHDNLD